VQVSDPFYLGTVYITEGEIIQQISKGMQVQLFAQQLSPLRANALQVFYGIG
jgi:hypothetical protein